jgi:multidrug resistance efflux pump
MRSYLKNNRKKLLGIGVVALILIVIISGKNDTSDAASTYTVVRKDVSDTLRLSGKVEAVNEVHMAFTGSGPVSQVYKHDGDKVVAGEKIVELDTASLRADLADAIANVNLQKANTQVSDAELDSDVSNAHTKLLSEDLVAYSVDPNSTITPPEVSGRYTLGTEGRYRVIVIPSGATSRMSIRYQGLEKGETEITFYKPIPLGSSGLYLKFNADETSVGDEWFIDIPNVGGASYTSNLNAYKSALASRDANAGEHISDAITMAKIAQAEARVASVSAQIEERILRAPFNGVVSKIDATRGEIVTASTPVATVISDNAFQVTVQIPEIDIVNVVPGLSASITLDAYGPSVVFPAKVTST